MQETQLAAQLGGKIVRYPISSTFVIEEKVDHKLGVVAQRDTIHAALTKFHALQNRGKKVRLSACFNGRTRKLVGV